MVRKVAAEFIGSALLLMAIVGSGIMAQSLTGDSGLQLLINAVSTILALFLLISLIAPISGAHFNPVVTLYSRAQGKSTNQELLMYVVAQFLGGAVGVIIANLMFSKAAIDLASTSRTGVGQFIGEVVATVGLLAIIAMKSERAALLVPAWIGSAFFFTSSTSFANPAVTVSRTLSDTFTGIAPGSIPQFVGAQLLALALVLGIRKLVKGS
jgi:glycerol uptake facilitator-like aquaporin